MGEILIWESSNLLLTDSRRDRLGDAGALAPRKDGVYGAGLASALWPSTRESLHIAPLPPVRRVALGRGCVDQSNRSKLLDCWSLFARAMPR
jgi:hypothetical protein